MHRKRLRGVCRLAVGRLITAEGRRTQATATSLRLRIRNDRAVLRSIISKVPPEHLDSRCSSRTFPPYLVAPEAEILIAARIVWAQIPYDPAVWNNRFRRIYRHDRYSSIWLFRSIRVGKLCRQCAIRRFRFDKLLFTTAFCSTTSFRLTDNA